MAAQEEVNCFLSDKNKLLLIILFSSLTLLMINPPSPNALVIKVGDEYLEWSQTHWLTDAEFSYGHSMKIGATERVRMWIFDDNYYLGVLNKTNTYATLVSSNPLSDPVIIYPGEEKDFEVTGDNRYDIHVKFNNFDYVNNKINLTIRSTNLQVVDETVPEQESSSSSKPRPELIYLEKPPINWTNVSLFVILGAIGLIIIGVIIFYIWKHFKKEEE